MATFGDLSGERLTVELNNSDTTQLFTSTRRSQAINDGIAEFAALTECYVRRSTVACSCNVTEYTLSTISDFARIAKEGAEYWFTSSGSSPRFTQLAGPDFARHDEAWRNRYEFGWRQSTTPVEFPQGYYVRSDGGKTVIGLSEPPDVGSSDTVRLIVPYVARPPAMTASTEVPFTDAAGNTRSDLTEYHQASVHFAAYRLLPLTGDTQGAQEQLQKFLAYVSRYQQNTRPKGGQFVTLGRNYWKDARRAGRDADLTWSRDPRWSWT